MMEMIEPMQPILSEHIPEGENWGYQLKWDGVRILSIGRDTGLGSNSALHYELYSRNGLLKNDVYPEIVEALSKVPASYVLDGEAIVFDPHKQRPNFQLALQRERSQGAYKKLPVHYVLFDMLVDQGEDLRSKPFIERFNRLKQWNEQYAVGQPTLLVSDLFRDGEALWQWVEQHEWEGLVSKKLTSRYTSGKQHRDWLKTKRSQYFQVQIVGYTIKATAVASFVMSYQGAYFGKVNAGLTFEQKKQWLTDQISLTDQPPFSPLPGELRNDVIRWLAQPLTCTVKGLEITDGGLLRHAQLVKGEIANGRHNL